MPLVANSVEDLPTIFEGYMDLYEGKIEVVASPWEVKVDSCIWKGRVSLDEDEPRRLGSAAETGLEEVSGTFEAGLEDLVGSTFLNLSNYSLVQMRRGNGISIEISLP